MAMTITPLLLLLTLQCHAILSEAKPYHHSNDNDWLHRKIESIFNRSKQRDVNNVIKQISALNSKDDRLNHIEDANQPDGLQLDGLQRRCGDWWCADMKAFNVTFRPPTPSFDVQTPAIPNPPLEEQTSTSTTEPPTTTSWLNSPPFTPPIPPNIVIVGPSSTTERITKSPATSDNPFKINWILPSLNRPINGNRKRPGHLRPWNGLKQQDQEWNSNGLRPEKPSWSINKSNNPDKSFFLNRINSVQNMLPWMRLRIEIEIFLKRRGLI